MTYFVIRKFNPSNNCWNFEQRFTNHSEAFRVLNNLRESFPDKAFCLFQEKVSLFSRDD